MHRDLVSTEESPETTRERIETLKAEHLALKARLDELGQNRWLTPEEQLERKRCQKLKLSKKDEIESLQRTLDSAN